MLPETLLWAFAELHVNASPIAARSAITRRASFVDMAVNCLLNGFHPADGGHNGFCPATGLEIHPLSEIAGRLARSRSAGDLFFERKGRAVCCIQKTERALKESLV
jgi:hypothetical protein